MKLIVLQSQRVHFVSMTKQTSCYELKLACFHSPHVWTEHCICCFYYKESQMRVAKFRNHHILLFTLQKWETSLQQVAVRGPERSKPVKYIVTLFTAAKKQICEMYPALFGYCIYGISGIFPLTAKMNMMVENVSATWNINLNIRI